MGWRMIVKAGRPWSAAIVLALVASSAIERTSPAHAESQSHRWAAAPHEGESTRAAIGCSSGTNDDNWTCLVVRCENDGSLGLYYEYSEGGVASPFAIAVDGQRFAVSPEPSPGGVPFQTRLAGDTPAIVSALRSGDAAKLTDVVPRLNPGFDEIPLRGSSRAIGNVVASCPGGGGGGVVTDGDLLRDAAGRVAIGNLTESSDCVPGKGSGTVDVREGDGVWFVDDQYGRGYINLDRVPPGPDHKVRTATLNYLLTPGRRLDIDVMGCGAAGRVEELMAAREQPGAVERVEVPDRGPKGKPVSPSARSRANSAIRATSSRTT